MDLSFDKLLEQFDLKKNEHQKNLHKVNKRIDEIESHMEEIKKQLHNFDHQIVNIEKELKTTLSMISSENESSSHHNIEQNKEHYEQNEHHEHQEQNRLQKHHKGHEHHPDHPNWAENLIHNVEEFSASIFEPKHEGKKEHKEHHEHEDHQQHQEHEHFEEKQHNSRVANRKKYNNQNIENINQYSASTMDESQLSGIATGLTSFNEKNYSELTSDFTNHNDEQHQHIDQGKVTNEKKTSEQLLETDFSDLSIDDWEDTTTNLSMSEWFEVDPNDKR
ncbi:hypothetical protein ABWK22_23140 [Gottfriedia acidiceleris]|uniref:hypothetical protein n=1 Tax=Gottfriedia acidiceleris TaxID=371036 RepID=UPI00339201D4